MTMLELYHNDMSVCAQKVRMALAEKGLDYEAHHLNLRRGDQKDADYLKLNPNGVVPTLVHDGTVFIESIVINEYIDDAFPHPPLRPADPTGRARVRQWTKQIDGGIFGATGTVSMSIAFHHQYPPEVVEALASLRPASWRRRFEALKKGPHNPAIPAAITRLDKMVADMNAALQNGPWLIGGQFTLADVAYAPYITRLDHLKFLGMLDARPRVMDWYERIQARHSYIEAIAAQVNPKYLPLMEEKGTEAWPIVKSLIETD